MQAVVLFLNDKPDDPTKRLKLAGVRRYAAAAGWKVVVADVAHSRAEDIPVLRSIPSPTSRRNSPAILPILSILSILSKQRTTHEPQRRSARNPRA